jgi:hypothetical protein
MQPRFATFLSIVFLSSALVVCQGTEALAITTGSVSGSVTDAATSTTITGAAVSAVSPSGTYHSTTDAKGYYILEGLMPDTYSIEARKAGYEPVMVYGVTVVQGSNVSVNIKATTQVKTLATIPVRGQASLVQPSLPVDTYSVGVQQVEQLGGTPMNDNEAVLIEELPGVSATGGSGSAGGLQGYYPLIRGGLENNEGFQLEGITATEPLTNQFINNLILDGARSINVVAGPGDATQGGAGSGYVNIVTKTGSYPPSGELGWEVGGPAFGHNAKFEYGTAAPNGRYSIFVSGRYDRNFGGCCAPPFSNTWGDFNTAQPDTAGQLSFVVTNDTVANLLYRFGNDNRNTLQIWNEWGSNKFFGDYGINVNAFPFASNETFDTFIYSLFGLGPNQIPFFAAPQFLGDNSMSAPNWQISQTQTLNNPAYQNGDFVLTKIGFSRQLDDKTFLNARVYRTQNSIPFWGPDTENPYLGYGFPFGGFGDFWEYDHTQNTGVAFDLQRSMSEHHFLQIGGEYRYSKAFQDIELPSLEIVFLGGFAGGAQWCEWTTVCGFNGALTNGGTVAPRMPSFSIQVRDPEYVSSAYITDQWKPSGRLTVQPGIRYEGQRIHTGGGLYDVHAISPRLSASLSLDPEQRTVLRATYGHATIFAPLAQVETYYTVPAAFRGIALPGGDPNANTCGGPNTPGTPFSGPCADLYDMVYNSYYQYFGVNPFAFPKPQESDTLDFSIEHDFGHAISMKLTPFYRRDYNVIANQASTLIVNGTAVNGPQTVTNAGKGHTLGVEFAVSRQVVHGISMQFNATYINQFINYFSNVAFLPTVQPGILHTDTLAHPVYLSPLSGAFTVDYRRSGWRIDPIWSFNDGYPIGVWQSSPINISPGGANPNGPYVFGPNTNTFGGFGGTFCYYTDPQIPGTPQHPNIVGSIGGGCTKNLHGGLTKPVVFLNLVVARDLGKNMQVGFEVWNAFDNVSNYPYYTANPGTINSYVNNGFGAYGPGSGTSQFAGVNVAAPASFPPGPWFNVPSGPGRQWQWFVTQKF